MTSEPDIHVTPVFLFNTIPLQHLLPLHNTFAKPHQKDRPTRPHLRRLIMRRHLGLKPTPITDTLDNPRDKRSTIEHAHLPRHADVRVDHGVIVGDHVLVRRVRRDGVLEGIG